MERLLPQFHPKHYTISLKPSFVDFTFSGQEKILFDLPHATKTLTLHAAELALSRATITVHAKVLEAVISTYPEEETVVFTFPEEIPAGEYVLEVTFTGVLSEKMRGFYRSKYEIDGKTEYMAVTQFEETEARRAFPCIDEPAAKAVFDITLVVPNNYTAVSNTLPDKETEEFDGYKAIHFQPTPKMATYVLAFLIGKFESIETHTPDGILVRAFTTKGKRAQSKFALDVAAKLLTFYQDYFAIRYPLPVLDLIAIPDFDAGAMENWGAVTFRESAILIDEKNSSLANKQWVALVTAHELAHMWFGDLVTMEWWTHLWLNEGFASYIEYLAVNKLFPEWDLWSQFIANEHNGALQLDGLANTHPIEVEVHKVNELKEIFDEISYAKGASVIHMLATYLGEEKFRDGLRLYLKKHAYGNTVTEDLWHAFSQVTGNSIEEIMSTWTQKGGYPVLFATKEGTDLALTQQRFFASSISSQKEKDTTLWHIPTTLVTPEDAKPLLLAEKMTTIEVPESWVKVNGAEASLTRVLYDEQLYTALGDAVAKKILSPVDRMGIIRDAFDGAEAGLVSTVLPLKMAKQYKEDTDYVVWTTLIGNFHKIADLLVEDKTLHDAFKTYVLDTLASIAEKVGWEKKEGETHTYTLLRGIVLRSYAHYGDEKTVQKAQTLFAQAMEGKLALDPDLRSVVYNTTAEQGGMDIFEVLTKKYIAEPLAQEKNRISFALVAFTDTQILQKTLAWTISDAVRPQDSSRIIAMMFGNPFGQDVALAFVISHWDYFVKLFEGQHGLTRLIEGMGMMRTQEQLDTVKTFFASHKTPGLSRTIQQVLEQIESNIAWMKRDKEAIRAFLLAHK